MTDAGRYDVTGLIEAQYQPGSRGRVLRNLRGITGKRELDEAEAREQRRALEEILSIVMAAQAGLPPLDFGHLKGRKKQEYFGAVRAGMD